MNNIIPLSHSLTVICILLASLVLISKASCCVLKPPSKNNTSQYIKTSCETTLYPKLCYKSLVKYSPKIRTNPKVLAITALRVAIKRTHSTSKIMKKLSKIRRLKRREHMAIVECVEEVSDSLYELRKSIKELNHSRKGSEFEFEMSNVQTWVSAALTDDDTCMDDFTSRGKIRILVRRRIMRIAHLTSIALAFINNYAQV